jgi:glycosyltransferase involved in cell wall biosynthesis
MISEVGVVVPAHDEERLLPACLDAVRDAVRRIPGIPVHLIVVADSCRDQTAERARRAGAGIVTIHARSAGAARAAGMRAVLRKASRSRPVNARLASTRLAATWLATTDADTLVAPDWLSRQLHYANQGWDAVAGTVTVTDWSEHPPGTQTVFAARYRHSAGSHPHVHGANLGVSAGAYLCAGGFPPLRTGEDHALAGRLTGAGRTILRATDVNVVTSARREARAPLGFGHLLTTLSPGPDS